MFTIPGHFLKETKRFESFPGAVFGSMIPGCTVGKTFSGTIHRRPEPVIVAVLRIGACFIGRFPQPGLCDEPEGSAFDIAFYLLLVEVRFLRQSHWTALQAPYAARSGKPCRALCVEGYGRDIIIRQPTTALQIRPSSSIKANRAQVC